MLFHSIAFIAANYSELIQTQACSNSVLGALIKWKLLTVGVPCWHIPCPLNSFSSPARHCFPDEALPKQMSPSLWGSNFPRTRPYKDFSPILPSMWFGDSPPSMSLMPLTVTVSEDCMDAYKNREEHIFGNIAQLSPLLFPF